MDATRARRTRDRARQQWYARHRQWRFARFLGFGSAAGVFCSAVLALLATGCAFHHSRHLSVLPGWIKVELATPSGTLVR